MEKYLKIAFEFLTKQYLPHIITALLLCIVSGGFMSFRNLNMSQAAKIMEMYAVFFGIVLFTPLFMPEQDREIWLLERSKATPMWKLYLIRMAEAMVLLLLFVTVFVFMILNGSRGIDGWELWFHSFCEILFLGSIGFFVSAVTNQAVLGYMVSVVYFAANFGGRKYFYKFALFQMMEGKTDFWGYMIAGAVTLFCIGIVIRENFKR